MARTDKCLSTALRAAQRGDEDAFRRLYRAVQPRLLRYLRVLVAEAADQVAAETWREITHGLGDFRGDFQRFRGWVTVIGRSRALDHLSARGPAAPATGAERTAGPRSVDAAIALIAGLPADQAEAVLLRVVMGLDTRQAAEISGRSAEAFQAAAYRGLANLADRLAESGAPPRVEDEPGAAALHRPRGDR